MAKLNLATCQFQVENTPQQNLRNISRQMRAARKRGAHLAHFSEACLSGYLGAEVKSLRMVNWDLIHNALEQVQELAASLQLWVVIGCNHRLSSPHKPHNSLYVIDDRGQLITRYDKLFCTGKNTRDGDLRYYSPGQEFITFQVRNVCCGLLICHDFRYPELFREYKRQGVELMLVSFHCAGMTRRGFEHYQYSVPATVQAAAASNYYAVSVTNGTRRYAFPGMVVDAEGKLISRAPAHRNSVLVNRIDTRQHLYDASAAWREQCMNGTYHSGQCVDDLRSWTRTKL